MSAPELADRRPGEPTAPAPAPPRRPAIAGPEANEHLTSITGAVLIVLLAVLGVTILRIGQLIWLHLFVGLVLLGPVALKLASTGYRFVRYYTGSAAYRLKGPPPAWLRLLAPAVVASTLVVFGTGVALLFQGPSHRSPLLLAHKASFLLWLGATGLHVLGHLAQMPEVLRMHDPKRLRLGADTGRWIVLAGAIVGGLVLAVALLGHFGAWTATASHWHH